jgi:hypothetical protein
MREGSFATAGNANGGATHLGDGFRPIGWAASVIRLKAKALWHNKTAAELALRTGLSVHATDKILRGERGMGLDAFANLIASADGIEFFGAIIDAMPAKARARWEREFERAARSAELRRRRELLMEEIERHEADEAQLRLPVSRRT